jgi:signal transduction histidine kinase
MADDLAGEDRYRREVIGNVAHELRTPVAALHAVLENMVDGVRNPDQATLELALSQTDRLGRLITELLDLSRIEGGVAQLDRSSIDLDCFARTAVAECRLRSREDISFAIDVTPSLAVHADEGRLHQVLANLLDNAARHSPAGGTVEVSAWPDGDSVVIDVADEGEGIAPAERQRIFERFSRGGSRDGGTGLGLAIAQWVITLHAGDIGVIDDPRGCRIRIRLPLVPAD